jgi:DNA-binding transcriptional LysR family regulator
MPSPLDMDQLQTFVAISDTGSFTRAAEGVFKTQSAVSMQMRRLEERIGRPLFEKDGRMNRLTDDGERLLTYARRMMRLNGEAVAAFDDSRLAGHLRIGMPDDYADRFLPEIMARFVRSNPRVELSVVCEPTVNLIEQVNRSAIDLALITHVEENGYSEIVRREPLLWVTSANHAAHEEPVLPLAFGRPTCVWRHKAIEALGNMKRDYRVLFTSWSATVISASVLSGLAVSVLAECSLRPGMRVLTEADGFPPLADVEIGLIRARGRHSPIVDAMAQHVIESLDNLGPPRFGMPMADDSAAIRLRRTPASMQPRW